MQFSNVCRPQKDMAIPIISSPSFLRFCNGCDYTQTVAIRMHPLTLSTSLVLLQAQTLPRESSRFISDTIMIDITKRHTSWTSKEIFITSEMPVVPVHTANQSVLREDSCCLSKKLTHNCSAQNDTPSSIDVIALKSACSWEGLALLRTRMSYRTEK